MRGGKHGVMAMGRMRIGFGGQLFARAVIRRGFSGMGMAALCGGERVFAAIGPIAMQRNRIRHQQRHRHEDTDTSPVHGR